MTQDALLQPAQKKEAQLLTLLRNYDSLLIAYSGGVDSTYLAAVAHEVLGERACMLIFDSPSFPRNELEEAVALAQSRGWRMTVLQSREFENPDFCRNDAQRCYYCKATLFSQMYEYASAHRIATLACGEIAEDALDPTRVGARAAQENDVVTPLAAVGLNKEEIRVLSRLRHLPTWDKASFACLATRVPMGERLDKTLLHQIEQAEAIFRQHGFHQYRVRHHGALCRIEIEAEDFSRMLDTETRETIVGELKGLGYSQVTLDLAPYAAKARVAPSESPDTAR